MYSVTDWAIFVNQRYEVLLPEDVRRGHLGFKSKLALNTQIQTTREQVGEVRVLKCNSVSLQEICRQK